MENKFMQFLLDLNAITTKFIQEYTMKNNSDSENFNLEDLKNLCRELVDAGLPRSEIFKTIRDVGEADNLIDVSEKNYKDLYQSLYDLHTK